MRTLWIATLFFAAVLSSCTHENPNFTYMPDMYWGPSIKPQEKESVRTPVPGTIARDQSVYHFASDPEGAGRALKNPLERTRAVLLRGQDRFNTYCIVCHGPMGEGDGYIVPKFPRPLSLQTDRVKNYPDGRIFHIITIGQNLMPSYASQVPEADRWAIIHYLRAMYRAKHPSAADLKAAENW